jgi:hypothetical protein
MFQQNTVRTSLLLSAIYNIIGGALFAFPSSYVSQMFGFPNEVNPLYAALLSYAIVLFGLMYFWHSRQIDIYRPMLALSGFAKIGIYTVMASMWCLGHASGKFMILVSGDLIFGVMWLWALYHHRIGEVSE